MKQILVYGDSLSWGIIPGSRKRLAFDKRLPGVVEKQLLAQGHAIRVIENCLNGRRTVWSDPYKPGRDGSEGLGQAIEICSPLALVVLMLGTNDFQVMHHHNTWMSSQGMAKLITIIRQAPIEPGMPVPDILIVAPPKMLSPKGPVAVKFEDAEHKCIGLADALKRVAEEQQVYFFDASDVTEASRIDGIHLDEDQHQTLGLALSEVIKCIIELQE
ncbi:SGNH/GDSL hydrolase family protein [Neptunomonas qingdaonensis]|uniref:Lysophospholipase L1 n=1 Tax=Neptunomonas qingdaonensis TaxID=1045558 RepID=A0A1I2S4M6_9GAMM|nr:SGNH/GDSL hydrolase family protein [Neptunomonas qingdaonensis]SFG45787.1 Lysophospholipase L1 [Neptunomonas qingdaonensis]